MALYYDTAKIIETLGNDSVDLKQLIYNDKSLKSNAGTVFALVSESIKWSEIISEVIEHSNLLELEKKVCPFLPSTTSLDYLNFCSNHSIACL